MSRTIEDYVLAALASGCGTDAGTPADIYKFGRSVAAVACEHLGHVPDPIYGQDPLGVAVDEKRRCRRCRAVLAEG